MQVSRCSPYKSTYYLELFNFTVFFFDCQGMLVTLTFNIDLHGSLHSFFFGEIKPFPLIFIFFVKKYDLHLCLDLCYIFLCFESSMPHNHIPSHLRAQARSITQPCIVLRNCTNSPSYLTFVSRNMTFTLT